MSEPLRGSQTPTYEWCPPAFSTAGPDAVDLAAQGGVVMDEWQGNILAGSLGETATGLWVCNEVLLIVGRQNGKGGIIEARELAGVFLFDETLILHSAHQQRTSNDAFLRMKTIVQSTPDWDRAVTQIAHSKGEEGITFRIRHQTRADRCERCRVTDSDSHEAKIRYMARTGGGGRGFTKANLVILDEAMILDDPPIAALLPTMATQPNWQVWYTASQGDRRLPTESRVLARVRRRGFRREPGLYFAEWAAHIRHTPECPTGPDGEPVDVLDDRNAPRTWAKTNPAMNLVRPNGTIGIPESFLAKMAYGGMASWDFEREFLGVGDYPTDDGWSVIGEPQWNALKDVASRRGSALAVGIDVAWDQRSATVAVASIRDDGMWHWEMVRNEPGTVWVGPYCARLLPWKPVVFSIDAKCPVLGDVHEAVGKARCYSPDGTTYAGWCAKTLQIVTESKTARHLGQDTLTTAVKAARRKEHGGGTFTWLRQDPTADVTPWIAITYATGGILAKGTKRRRKPLVAAG